MRKNINNVVFTKGLSVSGMLHSSFCFISEEERSKWILKDLPILEEQFGVLSVFCFDIFPLKPGDRCHVLGEGNDIFKIEKVICYSKNRYGFILDSGVSEEVVKCYPIIFEEDE
jgi:hypothetical protein